MKFAQSQKSAGKKFLRVKKAYASVMFSVVKTKSYERRRPLDVEIAG